MNVRKIIGVVGGIGPQAGIELCNKILEETQANTDQEHLSVAMLSFPSEISDRTSFILGETKINPAFAIVEVIKKLESIGAEVIGIACNTSHTPLIYHVIEEELNKSRSQVKLLHIIVEVTDYIRKNYPNAKNVGVMCTMGTYRSKVYEDWLNSAQFNPIIPNKFIQKEIIHDAIYNPQYGIKAQANSVTNKAKLQLLEAVEYFKHRGSDVIILGCTEISLAITSNMVKNIIIIDSAQILAKALVREAMNKDYDL